MKFKNKTTMKLFKKFFTHKIQSKEIESFKEKTTNIKLMDTKLKELIDSIIPFFTDKDLNYKVQVEDETKMTYKINGLKIIHLNYNEETEGIYVVEIPILGDKLYEVKDGDERKKLDKAIRKFESNKFEELTFENKELEEYSKFEKIDLSIDKMDKTIKNVIDFAKKRVFCIHMKENLIDKLENFISLLKELPDNKK